MTYPVMGDLLFEFLFKNDQFCDFYHPFKVGKRLVLFYDLGSSKLVCDLLSTLITQSPDSLSPRIAIVGGTFLE